MNSVFSRWKAGLERSSKASLGRIAALFGLSEIKDDFWDELESLLIQADLGMSTAQAILDSLRVVVRRQGVIHAAEMRDLLESELRFRLSDPVFPDFAAKPTVILVVGVNGSGKTTSIAKLGRIFSKEGREVVLIGGDTFRAAAVDQLQVWADRLDIPIVAGKMGSDPGSVVYDGIHSAVAKNKDIALIDTAGRLHTRYNLMEELKKVHRVTGKALPGAPHEVWLVLDATTGQNGLLQARAFKEAVGITGIILAKLDSSARGGMVFAIQAELGLPILYAGLGEGPDDLVPFNPDSFIQGILRW
jgi:fused signal recognition particle receptor